MCNLAKGFINIEQIKTISGWRCNGTVPLIPVCGTLSPWSGVSCTSGGLVNSVALPGYGIRGTISSSIGKYRKKTLKAVV